MFSLVFPRLIHPLIMLISDTLQAEKQDHLVLQMGWGRWTTCSASCGGGIKVRSRYRAIEAVASFRNKETDVQRCNTEPCHMMKAAWSEWGTWGDCSVTCGGGARIRFRYCKKSSAISRSRCPGRRYAVEQCNVKECPNKGGFWIPFNIKIREHTFLFKRTIFAFPIWFCSLCLPFHSLSINKIRTKAIYLIKVLLRIVCALFKQQQ